jgi:hypothetical protein
MPIVENLATPITTDIASLNALSCIDGFSYNIDKIGRISKKQIMAARKANIICGNCNFNIYNLVMQNNKIIRSR